MSSHWQIIESGLLSPEAVMAKDAALLAQLDPDGPSLLHFYEWNAPCFTHGYFTDPTHYLHLEVMQDYGLQKARRPTGGGIIFHLSDLAFSVFIPSRHPRYSFNTLENYALINHQVAEAVAQFSLQSLQLQLLDQEPLCLNKECKPFCMAKPTQYDLIVNGKKLGGAAQRRTKQGFLHQMSLSLSPPPLDLLQKILKNQELVLEAMEKHSYYLLSDQTSMHDFYLAKMQLKDLFKKTFCSM